MRAAQGRLQMRGGGRPEGAAIRAPRRHRQHATALLLCLLLCSLTFSTSAQAEPETIAGFGTEAGQVSNPRGVAVDPSTGDAFVADRNNFRIDKFDSEGHFLFSWGLGVRDGEPVWQTCGPQATPPTTECEVGLRSELGGLGPDAVAFDPVTGSAYVANGSAYDVTKFTPEGEFVFVVGRDVNKTKAAEGGADQAERNLCTAASGDTCGPGVSGSGPNEFENQIRSLAIQSTGAIWVGDTDRIASFDASGVAGPEISLPGAGETRSIAVDSADSLYVVSEALPGVRKLEAGTGAYLETIDAAGFPRAVTFDEAGNLYVGDCGGSTNECPSYHFKIYNTSGEQTFQFGGGEVVGAPEGTSLAIGETAERLYAASFRTAESVVQAFPLPELGPLIEDEGVTQLLPTSATLTATLNPEGDETAYQYEYGASQSYGHSTPSATLTGSGFVREDVEAGIEGLLPETAYHFRVVATNHCNPAEPDEDCTVRGEDQTFTTPAAVEIGGQWATDVSAHSASVHAELDPLGVAGEWWLEYGIGVDYGTSTAHIAFPASLGDIPVGTLLTGLEAGTTYHYRFAAMDERNGVLYTVHGADRTFVTQPAAIDFQLADSRAWEMVSPPDKHGGRLTGQREGILQASADGDALAYLSYGSIEQNPEGYRSEGASVLARRGEGGTWRSKDLTTPNSRVAPLALGKGNEYKLFSEDLSEGLVIPRTDTPLSPEASELTPYLRENREPPGYRPLVTGKEPYANVPLGTEFGGVDSFIVPVGASPDFKYFALRSTAPLVDGAPHSGLYEWSNGQIEPVSVLPSGEGGGMVAANLVGSGEASVQGAVSEDGSRVIWSLGSSPSDASDLYVRDTKSEETGRLDLVQAGPGEGTPHPLFLGASADGRVVFFTDSQQLTEDSSPNGSDLYRCELPLGSVSAGCATLTDISTATGAGESAEVQGIASAISEDAQAVYFVAKGVLDDAPNAFGDTAVPGKPNLYLWRQGSGVRYLTTLSGEDQPVWGASSSNPVEGVQLGLAAAASPSGRYFAFSSQRSLTGYDNRDSSSGQPAQEVFRYDAVANQLECISCNPTGARPRSLLTSMYSAVDWYQTWDSKPVAAILPEATVIGNGGVSLYRPRVVFDSGRVFVNAADSLVPADSNSQWDVYEYEGVGTGDCTAASAAGSIVRSAGGCVSLVSSGTGEDETSFIDASASGDDVFFLTEAKLSVLDGDDELDVYDARVGGVPATLSPSAECLGEACQPSLVAPNDPTPASAAFRGAGNVRPQSGKNCGKGRRKVRRHGHVRCVRKHRAVNHKPRSGRSGRAGL
jgi:hypothetical protein